GQFSRVPQIARQVRQRSGRRDRKRSRSLRVQPADVRDHLNGLSYRRQCRRVERLRHQCVTARENQMPLRGAVMWQHVTNSRTVIEWESKRLTTVEVDQACFRRLALQHGHVQETPAIGHQRWRDVDDVLLPEFGELNWNATGSGDAEQSALKRAEDAPNV